MYQYSQGKHHTQAHKAIPAGCIEEEQGRKGFFGPVSQLIKSEASTKWTNINGPLKPRLYDLVEMKYDTGRWHRMLYNGDVSLYSCWNEITALTADTNELSAFRNGDADMLLFCHAGSGMVMTEYGLLHFKVGSYVCIPKSLHHTFIFAEKTQFIIIESTSTFFREPDRGNPARRHRRAVPGPSEGIVRRPAAFH